MRRIDRGAANTLRTSGFLVVLHFFAFLDTFGNDAYCFERAWYWIYDEPYQDGNEAHLRASTVQLGLGSFGAWDLERDDTG